MSNCGKLLATLLVFCGIIANAPQALAIGRLFIAATPNASTMVAVRNDRKKMHPELELYRKRLISRRQVSFAQLRALADAGDSLGAIAFANRLSALKNPRFVSDALHYYAQAALGGRAYAVRPILEIVAKYDVLLRSSHLRQAEQALKIFAMRGNSVASEGLVVLYSNGKPFGFKPEEVTRLLERRVKNGDADAAYRIAISKLSGAARTAENTRSAIQYLKIASRKGSFGVRLSATNMLAVLATQQPLATTETKP